MTKLHFLSPTGLYWKCKDNPEEGGRFEGKGGFVVYTDILVEGNRNKILYIQKTLFVESRISVIPEHRTLKFISFW